MQRFISVFLVMISIVLVSAVYSHAATVEKAAIADFPVWANISLGTGPKTGGNFIEAVKGSGGMPIQDMAKIMLNSPSFVVMPKETKLNLALATVKDLTGKESATIRELYDAIEKLGGKLCPPDVGPQIFLQRPDLLTEEYFIRVAMDHLAVNEKLYIFLVGVWPKQGVFLAGTPEDLDSRADGGGYWIFVLPE